MEVRIILFAIVVYMVYKFVRRFLMPIMKMTRMTQNHLNDMRQKMEHMEQKQNNHQSSRRVDGDYIDYEEIK
jgi:uncharacterized membrane protein (DUF106 family)